MDPNTERILRRAYAEGVERYGPLPLPFEAFASAVLERTARRLARSQISPTPRRTAEALERAAGRDLYLAIAADQGLGEAWAAFTAAFLPRLKGLAQSSGASEAEAEEAAHELPGHLASPPPGGETRTRIGRYEGGGSLFAWLAVILERRLIDRARERKATPLPLDESSGCEPAASAQGPADLAVDGETRRLVSEALGVAWQRLRPGEALALLYKYRDGLTQREIARLLGLGEPRVSQLVAQAVGRIRSTLRHRLGEMSGALSGARAALEYVLGDRLQSSPSSARPPTKERKDHAGQAT
jgi:RNA polymerase sigma factor (sigma-70 family)